MIILGLTGSIGMGKSTVAKMLGDMGVPVHESDAAVHQLLARGGKAVRVLKKIFPQSYNPRTQSIDRAVLGKIVFNKPKELKKLEAILHPLVRRAQQEFIKKHKKSKIVVLDIPLLYETQAEKRVDAVVLVSAPYSIQKERVLERQGMTYQRFRQILALQIPDREKRKRADIIIPTGQGRAVTKNALQRMLEALKVIT